MAYIRSVKTKSGATAVQIAYTAYGKIIRIDHIGSAHNDSDLELLKFAAKTKLSSGQTSLLDTEPNTHFVLKRSVSGLLYSTLLQQYNTLGFDALGDNDFANLVIARLVEPTSAV
jgi:hypothetical protein